jgi:hypothetical protein
MEGSSPTPQGDGGKARWDDGLPGASKEYGR